jgi:hypothetical protein
MANDEPLIKYFPPDDEESSSPLADALNRVAKEIPRLHDPAEVEAFMKSVEGLPDAPERYEQFVQEIAARYEKWAADNGVEPH